MTPLPIIARFEFDFGAFQLDVDLTLPGRGITVLFGHSGSGKTTLLRCISGLQYAQTVILKLTALSGRTTKQDICTNI